MTMAVLRQCVMAWLFQNSCQPRKQCSLLGAWGPFFLGGGVIVVKSVGGHWKQAHQNPALLFTSLLTLGRLSPLMEPWISHP